MHSTICVEITEYRQQQSHNNDITEMVIFGGAMSMCYFGMMLLEAHAHGLSRFEIVLNGHKNRLKLTTKPKAALAIIFKREMISCLMKI